MKININKKSGIMPPNLSLYWGWSSTTNICYNYVYYSPMMVIFEIVAYRPLYLTGTFQGMLLVSKLCILKLKPFEFQRFTLWSWDFRRRKMWANRRTQNFRADGKEKIILETHKLRHLCEDLNEQSHELVRKMHALLKKHAFSLKCSTIKPYRDDHTYV